MNYFALDPPFVRLWDLLDSYLGSRGVVEGRAEQLSEQYFFAPKETIDG